MGPKHGTVVFSIMRTDRRGGELGPDHVYLLECVRDFGSLETTDGNGRKRTDNLCDLIRLRDTAEHEMLTIDAAIADGRVEAHALTLTGK
jgi:hypothetical protein